MEPVVRYSSRFENSSRNAFSPRALNSDRNLKEVAMRKVLIALAALAALGVVVPNATPAKADETVVVKHHHQHLWNYGPRHDKTVIIKHRDHDHEY
jgi:hypothetical protein